MKVLATCRRTLQFRAGPGAYSFAACEDHREDLVRGNVPNFFAAPHDRLTELTEDDDVECWFCRTL